MKDDQFLRDLTATSVYLYWKIFYFCFTYENNIQPKQKEVLSNLFLPIKSNIYNLWIFEKQDTSEVIFRNTQTAMSN